MGKLDWLVGIGRVGRRLILLVEWRRYTEADMPKWFAALDKDGSGELSREEMHEHKVKGRKEAKQKAIDDEKRAEEERKQQIIDDQIAEDLRIEQEKEAKAKAEREEAERKVCVLTSVRALSMSLVW